MDSHKELCVLVAEALGWTSIRQDEDGVYHGHPPGADMGTYPGPALPSWDLDMNWALLLEAEGWRWFTSESLRGVNITCFSNDELRVASHFEAWHKVERNRRNVVATYATARCKAWLLIKKREK